MECVKFLKLIGFPYYVCLGKVSIQELKIASFFKLFELHGMYFGSFIQATQLGQVNKLPRWVLQHPNQSRCPCIILFLIDLIPICFYFWLGPKAGNKRQRFITDTMVNKKKRKVETEKYPNGSQPHNLGSVVSNGKLSDSLSISSFDPSSDQESSSNGTDEFNLKMSSTSSDSEPVSALPNGNTTSAKSGQQMKSKQDPLESSTTKESPHSGIQGKPSVGIPNGSAGASNCNGTQGKTPDKPSIGITTSSACLINTSATLIQSSVSVITFLAYSIPAASAVPGVSNCNRMLQSNDALYYGGVYLIKIILINLG